ncbi:hypothetical protein MTR_1g064420 [Medicago truncatula]|uniref:Uncharacterized protein n=1 Tax=Medicago truncatula TaxID=3880 RepID=A0A072VJK3_MEDTR|nr:hypothetical protein MTR_1g064420 [Medicago truncatula]
MTNLLPLRNLAEEDVNQHQFKSFDYFLHYAMVAIKHEQYIQTTKVSILDKPESIQIIEHTSDKIAEISTAIFYRHGRTKMINSNIYTCGKIVAFEVFVTKISEKKRKTKRE